MIKFFRKIRQNLLMENKTGKYFKYAIGEIILVVIGILIALQINNWNEGRLNKKIEQEYLIGIDANLSSDIRELEGHLKTDTVKLNAYTYLIRAFNSDTISAADPLIISSIYSIIIPIWFEGQNVVFDDLKSSGRLNLITTDSIKHKVQTYYRFFEETVKRENLTNANIIKSWDKLFKYIPISSFLEPTFKEQWNGNIGPPNLVFTEKLDFKLNKAEIIDYLSFMKANQFQAYKVRSQLYKKSLDLKKQIEVETQSENK
jgi:hypothetical protein